MRKRHIITTIIIGVILTGIITMWYIVSNVKTPDYEILKAEGNIEIRKYSPMIIAEVNINGQRKNAISNGFRLLADYIFGNNMVKQDIAMTAPVQQQQKGDSWQISFIMPPEYNIDTLPKPVNELITLKEIPSKQFIVITFSGSNSDKNIKEHEEKLIKYIRSNNILVINHPKYAFYNPPWTLPTMRRNEIMLEIRE